MEWFIIEPLDKIKKRKLSIIFDTSEFYSKAQTEQKYVIADIYMATFINGVKDYLYKMHINIICHTQYVLVR